MSKNYSGLMEAYASIYQQPESVVEDNVEEICFEDLEVDADIMVDLVVDRLIVEGYANTDNQALNMIPHMSDAWLDSIIGNFVLEESFIDAVNSFVEEGYDLSSYTWDELYEDYIGHFDNYLTEDHRMDLQEVVPLLAAPLLANPATLAAGAGLAAGAAYAGKKAYDAYRQMRTGTDPASQRWLETGSYASTKEKPTQKPAQDQRRLQQAKERLQQRQQQPPAAPSQPAKPPTLTPEKVAPKGSSGTSTGGAPAAGPTPPKGPNLVQRVLSDFGKAFKQSSSKPPSGGGTPPSGPVKPNPLATAAGKVGGVLYQGAKPVLKGAGFGLGALGAGLGVAGTADEILSRGAGRTALRKTLEFTRQAGPAIRGEKPEAGLDLTPQGTIKLR